MLALRAGVWKVIWKQSGVMTLELEVTAAKLTGDPERDIKSLSNHVFMLEEKLRYTLRNLDVTNFNDLGLARYENGRLQVYTKAVEIQTEKLRVEFGKETDEIHALISATADELMAEIEDVEGNYTTLKATVNGIQSTVSSHTSSIGSLQSQITQTSNKISAVVSAVDDSSGNVTAASIVAAINAAGSSVQISADHIELTGEFVTISDLAGNGTVEINAGNIAAGGTISGVALQTRSGPLAAITIDTDTILFGDMAMIGLGNYNLGIFANHGALELAGYDGVTVYHNGQTGRYWKFEEWGMCLYNKDGSVYAQIVADLV